MNINTRRPLHISIPISPAPNPSSPTPPKTSSSSTALTALIILLALFFFGFFSAYAHRQLRACRRRRLRLVPTSQQHSTQQQRRPRKGLDAAVVDALPVLCYAGGSKEGCVVCLGDFEDKERLKVIPGCGHAFHPECIELWLVRSGSCPICRCTKMLGSSGAESKDLKQFLEPEGGGKEAGGGGGEERC